MEADAESLASQARLRGIGRLCCLEELFHLGPFALCCVPQVKLLLQVEPHAWFGAEGIG